MAKQSRVISSITYSAHAWFLSGGRGGGRGRGGRRGRGGGRRGRINVSWTTQGQNLSNGTRCDFYYSTSQAFWLDFHPPKPHLLNPSPFTTASPQELPSSQALHILAAWEQMKKNDRLAKIKISSQPTGNLRAIAAHLSTAGKINNNIDSKLLFKCFYNMCFVTAPTLWKFSPPCTKILTFLCLHLCLSILLWFWDDILTKKLAPLPREAQHVLEEESSSYMQKT